jgi:hypothetical protein
MQRFAKHLPILLVFGTTAIFAQPADPPAAPVAPAPAAPAPSPAALSAAEMQKQSAIISGELDEANRYMIHLREVAKAKKDVIKLNCINDRLVQLKAQRNIADNTNAQLQVALVANSDERHQLFIQLTGTGNTVKDLRSQATACIGEAELFKQESGVEVDHPEIPDEPGSLNPFDDLVIAEPPGYASPYD